MTFAIRRWYFLPALLFFSVVFLLLGQSSAKAAEPTSLDAISRASFQFVDRATIEATVSGQKYTFLDTNIGDDTYVYRIQGGGECGDAEILLNSKFDNGYSELDIFGVQGGGSGARISEVQLGYRTGGQGRCVYETFYDRVVSNAAGAAIWFRWVDAGTIERIDGRGQEIFVQSTAEGVDKRIFIDRSEGKCADIMLVSADLRSAKMYRLEDNKSNGADGIDEVNATDAALLAPVFSDECEVYGNTQAEGSATGGDTVVKNAGIITPASFTLANFEATARAVGTGGLAGGGTSSNNGDDEALGPDCYSGIATAFAWIICPTLGIIDNFLEWAERTVIGYLDVDVGSGEQVEQLRSSWAIFARLASIILVLVALTMVISTAMGFGVFDAYTVKKVLPRLVIATIAIWLSFSLILTYIDIMNVVGRGVGELMLAPFGDGASDFSLQNIAGAAAGDTDVVTEGLFTAIAAGTIAIGIAGIGGVFGLMSLAIAAVLGFVVAVVVLTLRQMIIILLLILAPLGIVAWILPNTQKIWKIWFETLNKLLLMFPMIVALLAAGKIFAYLFTQSGQDGVLSFVVPLLAYILPFFLMVTLFKASGTAFGKISGAVGNGGKGLTGRMRAPLDNASKQNKAFKDQMGKERLGRQAGQTGIVGRYGRTRMRIQGGQPVTGGAMTLRNRAATQDRVGSSMAAALDKIEKQQLDEAETLLDRELKGYVGDPAVLLLARAKDESASLAARQAALEKLISQKRTPQITEAKTAMAGTENGKKVWTNTASSKFGDLREFAPQLATTDATEIKPVFDGAKPPSIEGATKWSPDTWQAALDAHGADVRFQALAGAVMGSEATHRVLSGEVKQKLSTTTTAPPRPAGGGTGPGYMSPPEKVAADDAAKAAATKASTPPPVISTPPTATGTSMDGNWYTEHLDPSDPSAEWKPTKRV